MFIKYPSIMKLNAIRKHIRSDVKYHKQLELQQEIDEEQEEALELPTIQCSVTEKGHGTNMAVGYNNEDGLWVQSRTRIITPLQDNAGCAFAVKQNEEAWLNIILELAEDYEINLSTHSIYVFAEWIGGNIQGKSAMTGLEKHAVIFEFFGVAPKGTETITEWFNTNSRCREDRKILNTVDYYHNRFEINFNDITDISQIFEDLMLSIEKCSPLGKAFGKENTGEGIVGSLFFKGELLQFKVKGLEHTKSNKMPKKPKVALNDEELKPRVELAYKVCPEWRLEQMFKENCPDAVDMKSMGVFLKAVAGDIVKEEQDEFEKAGLTLSDIGKWTNEIAKEYYKNTIGGV